METQQQKSSVLSAYNVSMLLSSQSKNKTPAPRFSANINIHSYNQRLKSTSLPLGDLGER